MNGAAPLIPAVEAESHLRWMTWRPAGRRLHRMITRRNILALCAFTAVALAIAGIQGNHGHGFWQGVGDVAWFSFILGLVLLLVVGIARLARWAAGRATSAR